MNEFAGKIGRIRELATSHKLDAILIQRASNFAWVTCGASAYVNLASCYGAAALLITTDALYLVTDNIEAPRLVNEEKLAEQGWEFYTGYWYEMDHIVAGLTHGLKMGADGHIPGALNLGDEIDHLRAKLTPEEGGRFRTLGQLCAQAMEAAIRSVRPGQSEYEIAGLLSGEAERRGVQATVNLIATDERIARYRHPLPTEKKLERYAMLVLCGRKHGLVCSITRLIHFGRLPDEIRRKAEAVARVDATLIEATKPGRTLGEIFECAIDVYASVGYPDEWKLHHQGGAAGYEPREYLATSTSREVVTSGQVFAWNPSITGTKSEDTILVGENGNEILTSIHGWPELPITFDGKSIARPAILEI